MIDVIFDHKSAEPGDIVSFFFKPEHKPRQIAGQFIELFLPHENADERGEKRWFTLSSSPTEQLLAISTRINEGTSSFKKTLNNLDPGTKLKIAEPMGDFVLPKNTFSPLLFVAVGIGVTPFRSIMKYLSDTGEQRDIIMIYAARSSEGKLFSKIFEALGDQLRIIALEKLDHQLIVQTAGENRLIYLSGPEVVVEALTKSLWDQGIEKNRIITDYFHGYDNT